MALRFWNEHASKDKTAVIDWRIEIYDSAFSGDSIEFDVEAGAQITYRSDGDSPFVPILPSTLRFTMEIENTDHEQLITDMAGAVEGRFTVLLFKDTVFYWAGVINSPDLVIQDKYYPYSFDITAIDGLALLKNYEYRQDGTSATKWDLRYTGIDKLTDIVIRCLKKVPHITYHFVDNNKFLVSAVNWYAVEHEASPVSDTYDPLYYTELDNRFSVTGQSSGNAKFLSCYDVLYHVLLPFNARILHADGYFLIEQLEHRAYTVDTDDNFARYYNYDGIGPTATALTQNQAAGAFEDIKKLRGNTYSFIPPLKSARIRQQINPLQNLLSGTYFDSGDVEEVTVENVFGDGFSSYVRFSGNLEWSLENIDIGSGDVQMNARFRLKLQLGDKYATRTATYSIQNNFSYSKITWSATPGYIEIAVRMQLAAIGDTWSGSTPINFFFPNDGAFQQGDLVVSLEFIELQYITVVFPDTDYSLDWALRDPYCAISYSPKKIKILGLAPGAVNPKSVVYEVIGSDNNSETAEYETILGDRIGTVLNQWGGLLFNDGGTYSYTTFWGERNIDREIPITQLLAKRIMDYLYYPQKIYRGAVVGSTFSIQVPIDDNGEGEAYALKTGTYYTANDTMQGEWVRLVYGTPTLTYAPVEYDTGNLEAGTPNGGGSGGGSTPDGGSPVSSDADTIYTADGEIADTARIVTFQPGGYLQIGLDVEGEDSFVIVDDGGIGIGLLSSNSMVFAINEEAASFNTLINASKINGSSGDEHRISIDDGINSNLIRAQIDGGILLQSTADSIQIQGKTLLDGVLNTSTLSTDQNDFDVSTANFVRLNTSTAISITGLNGGIDGRIICIHNASSNPVTFVNASTSSTAANRFDIGEDYTLRSKHCLWAQHDGIDSRWRIIATDRLGRFTEAYTTSTATTASIAATTPATNVGVAVVTKGTGALTGQVPEGTSAGGNARGSYAVDWQRIRNSASEVASGTYSTIPGGRRCTASGAYGFATGLSGVASGDRSVAFSGTASGSDTLALGTGSVASGLASVALNADATADNTLAFITNATHYGAVALNNMRHLALSKLTTGTTTQELFLDGASLQASIAANKVWIAEVRVVAVVAAVGNGTVIAAGDVYAATYKVVIQNNGGTTAIIGTVQADMTPQYSASMNTASFQITADNTNDALKIEYVPGATEGTTTQINAYATIWYNEF